MSNDIIEARLVAIERELSSLRRELANARLQHVALANQTKLLETFVAKIEQQLVLLQQSLAGLTEP